MVSYVPQVREEQMVRIYRYVYVCVAPPMIVGVWSMTVVLLSKDFSQNMALSDVSYCVHGQ